MRVVPGWLKGKLARLFKYRRFLYAYLEASINIFRREPNPKEIRKTENWLKQERDNVRNNNFSNLSGVCQDYEGPLKIYFPKCKVYNTYPNGKSTDIFRFIFIPRCDSNDTNELVYIDIEKREPYENYFKKHVGQPYSKDCPICGQPCTMQIDEVNSEIFRLTVNCSGCGQLNEEQDVWVPITPSLQAYNP